MDPKTKDKPSTRMGRVLVVDDAQLVRLVVMGHLQGAGYSVDQAESGEAALTLLAAQRYDVVITDLNMPGLDGFEVLSRAKQVAPGIEVIILTGSHAEDMNAAVKALRLGAHDYLVKPPARPDEVVLAVERAMEKRLLRETNERLMKQLEVLSLTDALTGVPNRRAFDVALDREVSRAKRHRYPLALAILDIDHFKRVNDEHGHEAGDEVLRAFASTVTRALRKGDSLYRYGGEEFVAILPHASLAGALVASQRMVDATRASPVALGPRTLRITASVGVASLGDADGRETLARADAALYEAKRAGRDRVQASPEEAPS